VNAITLLNGPSGEKITNYSLPDRTAYHADNNRVDINRKEPYCYRVEQYG
jgi:hypothetical protein